MASLKDIFTDKKLIDKVQRRLPYLFQIAELECSRAGKIGMEVGSVREKIIVALLLHKFSEQNVQTEIPITNPEVDVKVFNQPLSIKTLSGKNFSGMKLIWTVDAEKSIEFQEKYRPSCDILMIQINWGGEGGFFLIPLEVQKRIYKSMTKENYIKLPKKGTNPRGVEMTKNALENLISDENTLKINIYWQKQEIEFNAFKRWIDLWNEE